MWYVSATGLPLGKVYLAQTAYSLNDIMFSLHQHKVTCISVNIEQTHLWFAEPKPD
jgi:hypothetical protein